MLAAEDYAEITTIADGGGFGDISDERIAALYDRYVEIMGRRLNGLPTARSILQRRVTLRAALGQVESLLDAYADLLEWLVSTNDMAELELALTDIRNRAKQRRITLEHYFALLEGIEPYSEMYPYLRQALANDYYDIAYTEIEGAFRHVRAEASFFEDVMRALLSLSSSAAHDLHDHRRKRREEAQDLNVRVTEEDTARETVIDMSQLRLALVGGHEATRRAVSLELEQRYKLTECVEVAPSSEAHIDRSSVHAKIGGCDLVAVITGYMGHDLSGIVRDLQQAGALTGRVLWLACRGKSGVVREIVAHMP